ncbi:hypothetical protein BT69DRAFT_1264548 [Atractiella rhizophila]|nr:hypothetical protein BT69DRAFT_1264548 [Atractiella rhizophila]
MPRKIDLASVIRSNILSLTPYRCARDDYSEGVLLDANENAYGPSLSSTSQSPDQPSEQASRDALQLHRYPSPTNFELKEHIGALRGVEKECVFLGVGSDEIIDLLIRVTCRPEKEGIVVCPPTYGMYKVSAKVNDVSVSTVPLKSDFSLDVEATNAFLDKHPESKLLLLTSPGNPTGTLLSLSSIRSILSNPNFNGLVVVDEAYIDFALVDPKNKDNGEGVSAVELLKEGWENLVVMQTMSKGFGLAGIRLGISFQSRALTTILSSTKAPYSLSTPTISLALSALSTSSLQKYRSNLLSLIRSRTSLISNLQSPNFQSLGIGKVIGGNDANFVLVQVLDKPQEEGGRPDNERAEKMYTYMAENEGGGEGEEKVVVRFRGRELFCEGCVRITVGTESECEVLMTRLSRTLREVLPVKR